MNDKPSPREAAGAFAVRLYIGGERPNAPRSKAFSRLGERSANGGERANATKNVLRTHMQQPTQYRQCHAAPNKCTTKGTGGPAARHPKTAQKRIQTAQKRQETAPEWQPLSNRLTRRGPVH